MSRKQLEERLMDGDDPQLWAVYADLLMTEGGVEQKLGELVALELGGKLSGEERVARVGEWLGMVPEYGSWDDVDIDENGDFEPPSTHPVPFLSVVRQLDLEWWGPFVVGAKIRQAGPMEYNDSGYSFPSSEGVDVRELLRALVASPVGRFLRRLVVEVGSDPPQRVGLGGLPASLRFLHVGTLQADNAPWCAAGNLAALSYELPRLQSLRVWSTGGACKLSPDAPYLELKSLVLVISEPDPDQINLIYPELFPSLETLKISFLWNTYWRADQTTLLWQSTNQKDSLDFLQRGLPALKHLALDGFPEAVPLLLQSPILPQLLSLELTGLNTEMLLLIAENDEHFLHIPDLSLGYDTDDRELIGRLPWHVRVNQPGSWHFSRE